MKSFTLLALSVLSATACKKSEPPAADKAAAAPATDKAPAAPAAPPAPTAGSCPAGTADTQNINVCVKPLPAILKLQPPADSGDQKHRLFSDEVGTTLEVTTAPYTQHDWDNWKDQFATSETANETSKAVTGTDGYWGEWTHKNDPTIPGFGAMIHNDKLIVTCVTWGLKDHPQDFAVLRDACKTIALK